MNVLYSGKAIFKKLSLLLVVVMAVTLFMPVTGARAAGSPADSAVQFLYNDYTKNGISNSEAGVGSYALFVLSRAGVNVGTWLNKGTNLRDAVVNAVSGDLANAADPSKVSAKLLAQDLAAVQVLGRNDLAGRLVQVLQSRQSSTGFDTGDYSLFSNLPAYDLLGRTGLIGTINEDFAKNYILNTQDAAVADAAYGSWGFTYGGTYYADFMATAEAVRALHYLNNAGNDASIQAAIASGLDWMKKQQQADGSFMAGMDDPVIDTAEVIVTLKTLGMDPTAWKNGGRSAVDYLMNKALNADGSFGTSRNDMDAIWVLCACNLLSTQFYLDPPGATLNTGEKKQFKAIWQDAAGSSDVTQCADWSVADKNIAVPDNSVKGLVTANQSGQTTVNAVYGGLIASGALTVNSSGNSSSGAAGGTTKTVGLAVVGMNGELLSGPSYVTVSNSDKWGLTVLGALDASGILYHTSSWSYGVLVDSIEGQANSGMAGWMFAVNGQVAGVGPDKYNLNDGDKIVWYYSKSMNQQPPQWDQLSNQSVNANASGQTTNLPAVVSDTVLNNAIQKAGAAGPVVLQADNNQTSLNLSGDQLTRILNAGKPLAVAIQGVQIVLSDDDLKVPELTAANTAQLQIQCVPLSGGSADVLDIIKPVADKLKLAGDVYQLDALAVAKDGTRQNIKRIPGCKVLLPVPAEAREAAAKGTLAAYWYNENSRDWENMGGAYDPASGVLTFQTDHLSKYALLENTSPSVSPPAPVPGVKTFTDIRGYWAQKEIESMAAQGYVSGVGDHEFAPDATITRAEFAVILARMAGLAADPDGAERFSDVPAGAWYRGMVGAAVKAGLVDGVSENSFAPDDPITREQMAVMLNRLMARKGLDTVISDADAGKVLARFSDAAAVSLWARTSAALMVREQVINGRENSRFVPLGNTTRAEAAVVLYRVLEKLPAPGQGR